MSTNKREAAIEFFDSFDKMEGVLGLPIGFLMSLEKEDDWSFVIKAHALIEAATTHLLVVSTGDTRLASVFKMLELSNTRTGKYAFINALDLVDSHMKRFIRKFSELRNLLVHEISNVSFSFDKHIKSLDSNQKKQWKIAFGYYGEYQDNEIKEGWLEASLTQPKFVIWWGTIGVITAAYSMSAKFQIEAQEAQIAFEKAKILDEFLEKNAEDK